MTIPERGRGIQFKKRWGVGGGGWGAPFSHFGQNPAGHVSAGMLRLGKLKRIVTDGRGKRLSPTPGMPGWAGWLGGGGWMGGGEGQEFCGQHPSRIRGG